MFSYLDILYLILSNYQKFLFYDASVSIIRSRDFAHIAIFYRLFVNFYLKSLKNIDELEKCCIHQNIYMACTDECIGVLKHYIKKTSLISEYSKKNINNILKQSAKIEKNNIKTLLFDDSDVFNDLSNTIYDFVVAYSELYNHTMIDVTDILAEFHNALSHIITAIAICSMNNKEDIIQRNIDRAISHLKRGTKDSYKILIKIAYQMCVKYKKLPEIFDEEFIYIRSQEIVSLSDRSCHNNIHQSIKFLSDKLIKNLNVDKNLDFKDEFTKLLNQSIIN